MRTNTDANASKEQFSELKTFIEKNGKKDGMLMQTLHKAQDIFGYLPLEVQKFISEELDIPVAEVYGVATFYTQFSIEPKGKHTIGVCLGTACYVRNSQAVLDKICEVLNIKVGETTEDNLFTLEATRCLGCCGLAPVMMIGDEVYGKVNPDNVKEILDSFR